MLEKSVAGSYISICDELSNHYQRGSIMESVIVLAKALSDPSRVRALMALRAGELCVCQIIAMLGLVPSTVSKHMSILRQAGLVRGQKRGKWMYYALAHKEKTATIFDWLNRSICRDPVVVNDAKTLKTIICRMGA